MPSTVDTQIFRQRDKIEAQKQLGLSPNRKYIGTAGGLYRDKGVETIYQAWEILEKERSDLHLVIAGPYKEDCAPPISDRVHYLGALPHHKIATLFQALDIGIISILDTPFGRYCFPQKAFEMLACDLPVVVANIGEMGYLFKDTPQALFEAGNSEDLALKLSQQLNMPLQTQVTIKDWQSIIKDIEPFITSLKFQR